MYILYTQNNTLFQILIFDFVLFIFYNVGSVFLTTLFNAVVIIEWFDLNFNSNSLFQILSIKEFLMCLCILSISLKMLKSFSSGLILINTQLSSFSNAFCLSVSSLIFLSDVQIHQFQLKIYIHENKDQPCSLKHYIEFVYFLLQTHLLLILLFFTL